MGYAPPALTHPTPSSHSRNSPKAADRPTTRCANKQSSFIILLPSAKAVLYYGQLEHYKWEIGYPADLRKNVETFYLKDPKFAAFYAKFKDTDQSTIRDENLTKNELREFIDSLFVIKKAAIFAGNTAKGEVFLIKQSSKQTNYGTAVLTFPNETQPIAFNVTSERQTPRSWRIRFGQPDRFVEFDGRI